VKFSNNYVFLHKGLTDNTGVGTMPTQLATLQLATLQLATLQLVTFQLGTLTTRHSDNSPL
jgi:hypothetical protein